MSDENGMLSYEKAVAAVRSISGQIRRLEDEISVAMGEHADAEAGYRAQYANKLREHRQAGATVAESEAFARAACTVPDRERIQAEHKVRELLERLEDRRGERHSLHRLMDWSMPSRPGPS
jgi:hypothetical protein